MKDEDWFLEACRLVDGGLETGFGCLEGGVGGLDDGFGDFGGYDVKDLPLFSSWFNRIKAFLMAGFITSLAYAFYLLIN